MQPYSHTVCLISKLCMQASHTTTSACPQRILHQYGM